MFRGHNIWITAWPEPHALGFRIQNAVLNQTGQYYPDLTSNKTRACVLFSNIHTIFSDLTIHWVSPHYKFLFYSPRFFKIKKDR